MAMKPRPIPEAEIGGIEEQFAMMPLDQQGTLLAKLSQINLDGREARAAELQAELDSLKLPKPAPNGSRAPASAKYRSLKDPSLVWSGRGAKAAWLVKEMEESGKALDAFLIPP